MWWLVSTRFGQNQPIFWFILGIHYFFLHLWQLWKKKNHDFVIGSRHFRFNHCSDRVQFGNGRSGSCNVRGRDQCLCRHGLLFSWRDCIKFEKTKILHSCPNCLHNCSHNNDLLVLFNRKLENHLHYCYNITCNYHVLLLCTLRLINTSIFIKRIKLKGTQIIKQDWVHKLWVKRYFEWRGLIKCKGITTHRLSLQ